MYGFIHAIGPMINVVKTALNHDFQNTNCLFLMVRVFLCREPSMVYI